MSRSKEHSKGDLHKQLEDNRLKFIVPIFVFSCVAVLQISLAVQLNFYITTDITWKKKTQIEDYV